MCRTLNKKDKSIKERKLSERKEPVHGLEDLIFKDVSVLLWLIFILKSKVQAN